MILPDHNAHLVKVESPAVPADPSIGIAGSPRVTKWQGDCQMHLQVGNEEVVHGPIGQQTRVTLPATIARIPSNLPTVIAENDLLTFRPNDQTTTTTLTVRSHDLWAWGVGVNRYILRTS